MTRFLTSLLVGLSAIAVPAPVQAQLIPGIIDRTNGVLDNLDQSIEDRLEEQVEGRLEMDLPGGIFGDVSALEGIGTLLDSSAVGSTLHDTLSIANELGVVVHGITTAPGGALPGRAVDLDMSDGWPIIRNEWIVIVPQSEAARVEALDVDIVERSDLRASDEILFVVGITATAPTAETIESELSSLGADVYDRNHVFRGASEADEAGLSQPVATPRPVPPETPGNLRIGLIDTDVDETHPDLSDVELFEADFVPYDALRPQTHGTAVASLLAVHGAHSSDGRRQLLAASAFFLLDDGVTGASSASLIEAIDWLQFNGADVINISLTGPPNRALEAVIRSRQEDGMIFVAAVGNEGPASGPLYPAAYDGVVGVTAVDAAGQVYRWANRGSFIDVAALGVNVQVAKPGGTHARDSGTSFAAPLVSAYLGGWTEATLIGNTAPAAIIMASTPGSPDRDDTVGVGILQPVAD